MKNWVNRLQRKKIYTIKKRFTDDEIIGSMKNIVEEIEDDTDDAKSKLPPS